MSTEPAPILAALAALETAERELEAAAQGVTARRRALREDRQAWRRRVGEELDAKARGLTPQQLTGSAAHAAALDASANLWRVARAQYFLDARHAEAAALLDEAIMRCVSRGPSPHLIAEALARAEERDALWRELNAGDEAHAAAEAEERAALEAAKSATAPDWLRELMGIITAMR